MLILLRSAFAGDDGANTRKLILLGIATLCSITAIVFADVCGIHVPSLSEGYGRSVGRSRDSGDSLPEKIGERTREVTRKIACRIVVTDDRAKQIESYLCRLFVQSRQPGEKQGMIKIIRNNPGDDDSVSSITKRYKRLNSDSNCFKSGTRSARCLDHGVDGDRDDGMDSSLQLGFDLGKIRR
jgi:hypothetical protein